MADLTARFGADFSAFSDGVQKAEAELRGFETGANKIQTALNRMTDSFSGRRVIQEAELMTKAVEELGGVSKMTDAELARISNTLGEAIPKMEAMGATVPDNMRALAAETKGAGKEMGVLGTVTSQVGGMIAAAFSLQAIIAFTLEAVHATAALAKVATQTGMTTDEIQKLQYAAAKTSVEFGTVVSATQGLAAALGDPGGNTGVINAIRHLGINMDDFVKMGAADQLEAISEKLRGMTNETERSAAAREIFGNKWKELIPLLLEDMDALGAAATKSTKETIAWTDEMESSWATFKLDFSAVVASTVVGFAQMVTAVTDWVASNSVVVKGFELLRAQFSDTSVAASGLEGAIAHAQAKLPPIGGAAAAAGVDLLEMAEAEKELDKSLEASFKKNAEEETRALEAATTKAAEAAKKAAEELKGWADAYDDVESSGGSWQERLAELDPQLVTHIQHLLDAGKRAEDVAKAYDLTAQNMKDFKSAQDESTKGLAAATKEAEGLTADLLRTGAEALQQFAVKANDSMQQIADKTQEAYLYMSANSSRYSEAEIARAADRARIAQDAANDWVLSEQAAAVQVEQAHAQAAQSVTMSWSQAMDAVRAGQGSMSMTVQGGAPASVSDIRAAAAEGRYYGPMDAYGRPDYAALGLDPNAVGGGPGGNPWAHRAAGGPVSAGSPYMVGEQGPELFVPDRGGTVVPNGGGGGMVANIYVNGTGQDVARIINAELTRMMRVGRKWPSV